MKKKRIFGSIFAGFSYLCKVHTKISHSGIVESIEDGHVRVRILQTSACAACKVAGHCNASESKEKIVDVLNIADTFHLNVGDEVMVCASRNVANKALMLGFGIPFLLMIGVLVAVLYTTDSEGVAALAAIGSLLPYYFLLWLRRDSIRQKISFYLE